MNTLQLWLPIDDKSTECEWEDFYTGEVIQDFSPPWAGPKLDGGQKTNCAWLVDENTWTYFECDSPHFACIRKHKPGKYLELKGLCRGTSFDIYYKPINHLVDSRKLTLQGLRHTLITYKNEEEIWILSVRDSNAPGISKASHASFTLGKHKWTLKGDRGRKKGESYVTALKMSGCEEGSFTCNDGRCVSMDQRCNQLPDCRDKSDERNCNILVLEEGYNKNVPPINFNVPVNVSVSMNVLKLVHIDEDDCSNEIQLRSL